MKKNTKQILMVANFSRRGKGPAAYVCDLINTIAAQAGNGIIIDVLIGAQGAYIEDGEVNARKIYKVQPSFFYRILLNLPKVRVVVWRYLKERLFKKAIGSSEYDYVVIHSLPSDTLKLVSIAKRSNAKVLLFPWGSEVMRAGNSIKGMLTKAFNNADYIRGDSDLFIESLLEIYPTIQKDKFVKLTYASPGVSSIERLRGNKTKEEMLASLHLPKDRYYIVCGYNAYWGQQHHKIIESIAKVKEDIPSNYLLVFPITYGHESGVGKNDIKVWCDSYGLSYVCLEEYLTDDQMACLHLITDVFIHMQITDLANSYIMEAVFADVKVINGSWLRYSELEQYGIPYHVCKSFEDLPKILVDVINGNSVVNVPNQLNSYIHSYSWTSVSKDWINFIVGN